MVPLIIFLLYPKSRLDAFDAEFSNIHIKKILIQGAIGECIGLKEENIRYLEQYSMIV